MLLLYLKFCITLVAGWTIKREELILKDRIGKGDFGDVYQGEYQNKKVAIKSLKDTDKAAQAFLAEASVMTLVFIILIFI